MQYIYREGDFDKLFKNYVKRDGYRAGIINTYSGGTQV
jgi:hypothetical protein